VTSTAWYSRGGIRKDVLFVPSLLLNFLTAGFKMQVSKFQGCKVANLNFQHTRIALNL
jgi:hypothetical protein